MKCKQTFILFLAVFCSSAVAHAQLWSGVLDPSRAIDWSAAGVVGGIPNRTTVCSTLNAGATAAQINTAISNCATAHAANNPLTGGGVVFLNAGTYNLSGGIVMGTNVTLRGAGADQTLLTFAGNNGCIGAGAAICFSADDDSSNYFGDAKMQPGGTNAATWTSGYTQGGTQIVLNNIGGNGISVNQYIYLDQAEDTARNSGFFVCENTSASPACSADGGQGDPGRVVGGIARQQVQIVKVTGCNPSCRNGATFTISPGLYAPNYASVHSPGAWWPSSSISYAGIEDLSMDSTNAGGSVGVEMFNGRNLWVKGTRQIRSSTASRSLGLEMHATTHATIQDNYFYGTSGQTENYGVESFIADQTLIVNNIFQHVVSPITLHTLTGSVVAYNYAINDTYDDGNSPQYHWMIGSIGGHSAGVMYNLFEGNIGPGAGGDASHGNPVMNTMFRNYWLGHDPNRIDNTYAVLLEAGSRYWNIVGNVLGTPGYTTAYEGSTPSWSGAGIYALGMERGGVTYDPVLQSTTMRWGNYDTVNAAGRWVAGENGSNAPTYPGLANPGQTLPASLYYSAKPSWWPAVKVWPPIGPDVTGGNVSGLGGHVYTIPAEDCYLNILGGPTNGSGNALSFNAMRCYGQTGGTAPSAPSNLRVQ